MANRREAGGRRPWWRPSRAFWLVSTALATGFCLVWFALIPWPFGLATRNPEWTSIMEQRVSEAEAAGEPLTLHKEWVPLEQISPNLIRAVIVAEDHRFREHSGVDWQAVAEEVRWDGGETFSWLSGRDLASLARALTYAWQNRADVRGRSTITQQLAKNLYFGIDRSFLRKGLEFVVARRLERKLTKDRILELYLNVAEWGPGIFGAEAASQAYFGVAARELTLGQSAALAGTLPQPLTSNPSQTPSQMRRRQTLILDRVAPVPEAPPIPEVLPPEISKDLLFP
ncbi:MAG: monofunctional biosynthetic peptidoglycan transglycosylase [Gemmatimonadetes bacterium]|nr:monofunctional biosynthetic peptidoglycan transglycosylase [Gemmatimonadota bacterium]